MIFAAIPDTTEATPVSDNTKLIACIAVLILLASILSGIGFYIVKK